MTYDEALDFFLKRPRFAKTNTLSRMEHLLCGLGNPERNLRFVHVAGTNGKGSVTAMLSSVLSRAGYRTGRFISPYIEDFRERVCVDGLMIPKPTFVRLTEKVKELADEMTDIPNFFELICALALRYFADSRCDIAVLETGLGGRWDATNVIPPPTLAVITSISLDHMEILGHTISEIAAEKSGILKPTSHALTLVSQPPEALQVIKDTAAGLEIPLTVPPSNADILTSSIEGTRFSISGLPFSVPLAGAHQVENALLAINAATELGRKGFKISYADIKEGIEKTKFPARLEIVERDPLILLDGAHNPAGMRALFDAISSLLPGRRIITVFGVVRSKDAVSMAEVAAAGSDVLITTEASAPNAQKAENLAPGRDALVIPDLKTALRRAKSTAGAEDVIVICGSLYLAGDARRLLRQPSN